MKLKTLIRILTTPSCWIRKYKTDLIWDMKLNQLLDKHDFADIGEYTAKLGNTLIWHSNHPYASFSPYRPVVGTVSILPTRTTVFRAYDKLVRQLMEEQT